MSFFGKLKYLVLFDGYFIFYYGERTINVCNIFVKANKALVGL